LVRANAQLVSGAAIRNVAVKSDAKRGQADTIVAGNEVAQFALQQICFATKEAAKRGAASSLSAAQARACSRNVFAALLLRPPAIVPDVGAIGPRDRLALDTPGGSLQRVVWNFEIENYFVAFDAVSNVPVHGTIL
jgi:hypothetical protein